jgi:putative oxidoreductase
VLAGPPTGSQAAAALFARVAAGLVFVIFGIGKFTSHGSEVDSFKTYGLPSPDAFVSVIGVIEIAGGALLLAGLAIRLVALILAGNMVGAIVVSGIGQGEPISLTLAPALLVAMGYLVWASAGSNQPRRP